MDRLIHTALNALSVRRDAQVTQAQNLANQNVPGFRRDLDNDGGARYLREAGAATSRAFRMETGPAKFSQDPGARQATENMLDIAIGDEGYFYSLPENGVPALTRRGDLRVDVDGNLRNGAGDQMLDIGLNPLNIPPYRQIVFDPLGEIFIEPLDGEPGELQQVGTLATIGATNVPLLKGLDGNIRAAQGELPPPDQQAEVMQGELESSNVNTVEELIASINMQREFEMGIRMIKAAAEIDEGGARLMRAPE